MKNMDLKVNYLIATAQEVNEYASKSNDFERSMFNVYKGQLIGAAHMLRFHNHDVDVYFAENDTIEKIVVDRVGYELNLINRKRGDNNGDC